MQFPNIEQIAKELGYRYDRQGPIHRFNGRFGDHVREISVITHWSYSGVEYIQKDANGAKKVHLWGYIERHPNQEEDIWQIRNLLKAPLDYQWTESLLSNC